MKVLAMLVAAAVLAVGGVAGVHELQEQTQYRVTHGAAGSVTTVTFDVHVHRYRHSEAVGAESLWQYCSANIPWSTRSASPAAVGEHRYRATLSPSLSDGPSDKLGGCLRDIVVDGVKGKLVALRSDRG